MHERVQFVAENHAEMYRQFGFRIRAMSPAELDWQIHPEANTVRWIVAHLLFIEEWTADMLAGDGKYQENKDPKQYAPQDLEVMRERYGQAFGRTQENMKAVRESDLTREIDMLGVVKAPLLAVLENHVHHTAGHMYQIRFIRGAYSRTHGTDKKLFDPW